MKFRHDKTIAIADSTENPATTGYPAPADGWPVAFGAPEKCAEIQFVESK
ncbi:TPA: hypothetical protein ACV4T7_004136 [Burkholderia ambifaria]